MQRIGLQLRGLAGTDVLQVQQDGGWKSPQCLRAICGDRRRARAVWRSGFGRDRVGGRNNALPVMLLYIFGAKAHASPRTDIGWWSLHFAGVRVRGCRCSLTPRLSFDVILHKPIQRSASKRRAALTDRDSIVLGRRQTTKFTASSERPVRGYHMVWAMPVLAVLSQTPGTRLQPAGYPPPLTSTV
jgi:hypothetical protein